MTSAPRPRRPRRQKKADRLISPGATPEQIKCDHALAPLDRLALKMDRKWGVDRLPELVSPETAQKYGSAMAKLNAAIEADDPDAVLHRAQVCMRGLAAMDREAAERGEPQASGEVWEYELDGFRFGILRDGAEWPAAKEARPNLPLFSLREVAVALQTMRLHHPLVQEAKKIGGAEMTGFKPKLDAAWFDQGGDEIPFGEPGRPH